MKTGLLTPFLMTFLGAVSLAGTCLEGTAHAQGARGSNQVVQAADANKDGQVTLEEWKQFSASVTTDERLNARAIQLSMITPLIDRDADGKWTKRDLDAIYKNLDTNEDGELSSREIGSVRGGAGINAGAIARLLARFADGHGGKSPDNTVSKEEWQAFVASTKPNAEGLLDTTVLTKVLLETEPESDRRLAEARPGAFTWKVTLMTFESQLDADGNGTRDLADLAAMFTAADVDGNGIATQTELATRPRRANRLAGARNRGTTGRRNNRSSSRGAVPLMPWQRNLEDALELQRRTGKPLLICVNVDGESACERLAANQYRDPEFAELADGFVVLLAAPQRHTLLDYNDRGQRILDPKYGRVTSHEHISIEPQLYEKYFGGRRVAPRHIGIDANGTPLFDIFLTGSLEPITEALRKHGKPSPSAKPIASLSIDELFESPDAAARDRLEELFVGADAKIRRELAMRALSSSRKTQHPELLRLALRDPDALVGRSGARSLAAHPYGASIEFFPLAFANVAYDEVTRGALIDGLHRLARSDDEGLAKRAGRLQRCLSGIFCRPSAAFDAWQKSLETASVSAALPPLTEDGFDALGDELSALDREVKAAPEDRGLHLKIAEKTLRYARIRILQGQNPSLFLDDAIAAADRATSAAEPDARALGLKAWASYLKGDSVTAMQVATEALPALAENASSEVAGRVLNLTISLRIRAIYAAINNDVEWPANWISEVHGASRVALMHPATDEKQAIAIATFFGTIEAYSAQAKFLMHCLRRFPASNKLHELTRTNASYLNGAVGLESSYYGLLDLDLDRDERASTEWYAGFAVLAAAERRVRCLQRDEAIESYDKSASLFAQSAASNPGYKSSADYYRVVALAGLARQQLGTGALGKAGNAMIKALALTTEQSRDGKDGLGNTPAATAELVLRALARNDAHEKTHAALRSAMDDAGL